MIQMKKIFTLAIAALTVAGVGAQERFMRIHMADGTSETIKVAEVAKITFEEEGDAPVNPGDRRLVDMGLSVKWAAWNVGATTPSDYGNFYAYGEIEPKTDYSVETYQWINPDYVEGQFYDQWEQYYKLGATFTGTNYDVAHVKWGDLWRMPTRREWIELIENSTWTWTAIDGVAGCRATSRINGNSIFFPAAGNMVGTDHTHDQTGCFYWTSSEYEDDPTVECRNYRANMDSSNHAADGYDYPDVGFSVRAVYGEVPSETIKYTAPSEPVDLGLSVKWAPFNVGGSSVSLAGEYFCWGETATKLYSHRYNYKHYDPLTDSHVNIGQNICATEYDPATQCWGEDWRLPTPEEVKELIEKCTWTRSGYDAIVTGPNGNSIRFPAMQFLSYAGKPSGFLSPINSGYYLTGDGGAEKWASGKPTENEVCTVLKFYMESGIYKLDDTTYRGMGMSVRPVYAK